MEFLDAMHFVESRNSVGMVLGLDTISNLLERLGNPQNELKFIHIAGTNGKGSVGAYIAHILVAAGYKVGRYVSPTIFEYCERIQMMEGEACTYITKEAVGDKIEKIQAAVQAMERAGEPLPTAFEIETAMAFLEFKDQKCDYVVLEVGLGGIEDATNVIETVELSVLTSISMDHMHILGDTIEEIAKKKAGIIKTGVDVVCYDYRDYEYGERIQKVIDGVCQKQGGRCYRADFTKLANQSFTLDKTCFSYDDVAYETKLLGENQPKNAALAIEAAKVLRGKGLYITDEIIQSGIKATEWRGRFSVVNQKPLVIVDGAHNEDAAKSLAKTLALYFGMKKVTFIVGIFADKEYEKLLKITCPYAKKVYCIQTDNPRALPSEKLAEVAKKYVDNVLDAKTVEQALDLVYSRSDEVVICFGSLSFLGEVYRYCKDKTCK